MTDTPPGDGGFGRRAAPPAAELPPEPQPAQPPAPVAAKPAREVLRPAEPVAVPRRSRGSRNQFVVFMNFLISAVVLLMLAGIAAVYFGRSIFDAPGTQTAATNFLVAPNTGVTEISEQLERRGLITDARVFQLGTRLTGASGSLKAGEYGIPAGASMRDIVEILRSGRSIQYSLTVPEGITVEQALARVAGHEALSGNMPTERPAEGSLAADTIPFTRGTPRTQIVEKLKSDQAKLVDEIWASRAPDLPIADKNEFVTLASIVEKETGIAAERPQVAAVFINRLNKNMRLQSDPTIIYGLFGGKGKPADRPIYQSDLEKPTPYNTYVINGLPPGPIATPGRAALEAVANPIQSDDLYFVADGSGGHVFAATLDEHNRNVARWRAEERRRAAEAGGTTPEAAQ